MSANSLKSDDDNRVANIVREVVEELDGIYRRRRINFLWTALKLIIVGVAGFSIGYNFAMS